jgi:stage V sporulation protein AF
MSHNGMEKVPISPKLTINEQFFKDKVGLDVSFDLGVRKITVLGKELNIYYVNGLCDTMYIIELMEELLHINDVEKKTYRLKEIIHNRLVNQQVENIEYMDEVVDQVGVDEHDELAGGAALADLVGNLFIRG